MYGDRAVVVETGGREGQIGQQLPGAAGPEGSCQCGDLTSVPVCR